jgi:hypothetical protein
MIRQEIYLRFRDDGNLERSPDRRAWINTGLSKDTVYEGRTFATLELLLDRFTQIERLEEIETELSLDVQRKIGRTLYRALFSPGEAIAGRWIHLVPVLSLDQIPETDQANEDLLSFVCRLPWTFLTRGDNDASPFVVRDALDPVSITIDAAPARDIARIRPKIRLPLFPNVWFVVPLFETSTDPTFGADHLGTLMKALRSHYAVRGIANRLVHLRTFNEFRDAVSENAPPDIIYFYGHADAYGDDTRFQFDHPTGGADWQSADSISEALLALNQRRSSGAAPAIWMNACKGASAERNSFLIALSRVASTVVTTRTLAAVDDSRAVAERALPLIIIDGRAPHSSLRETLQGSRQEVRSGRWATTVISVQYQEWSALGTEERPIVDTESAGDFPMRADRVRPLKSIAEHLTKQFDGLVQATHGIMWRGTGEHSLEVFSQRVTDLVVERFPQWSTVVRRIDLQPSVRPTNARSHYLNSVFLGLVDRPIDTTGHHLVDFNRLRSVLKNLVGIDRTILMLEHGPFAQADAAFIREYLHFWQKLEAELDLRNIETHVVLAFEFFDEFLGSGLPSESPQMQFGQDLFIETLGAVPPRELTDHLLKFRSFYRIWADEADGVAQQLVEQSAGRFREIHSKLEELARAVRSETVG